MELIVTADDLGISPGVNQAILDCHQRGYLTHASFMVNTPYFQDVVHEKLPQMPHLKVGLHINLTYGSPVSTKEMVPDLVDHQGQFKYGFWGLLWKSQSKEVKSQIRKEIQAQLERAKKAGITLSHIDSHWHVHTIPYINKIVNQEAAANGIKRIRQINERFVTTFLQTRSLSMLKPRNLIRHAVVRFLDAKNPGTDQYYFFSILLSSELTPAHFSKLLMPKGFSKMEIMVHPGMPEMDGSTPIHDKIVRPFLLSDFRNKERLVCLALGELQPLPFSK